MQSPLMDTPKASADPLSVKKVRHFIALQR